MPLISVNDATLHYEDYGRGIPIVFCHEFAQNHEGWSNQVSHFDRSYRVVTYSRRGYPPSAVPPDRDSYDFERNVADLKALCAALGLGPAHIVGHGAGGNIALAYALDCPDRLRSLVLVGAGAGSDDAATWKADAAKFADAVDAGGIGALVDSICSAPQRAAFRDGDPHGWDGFRALMGKMSAAGAANAMRGAFSRPTFFELEDRLRGFPVPTLLLLGDQDRPSFAGSRFVFETAPHAAMAILPNCGHTENLEAPALFNRLVEDFVAQHADCP
jgi:pimeloyl-ACP methyl ester carboxylesterase